MSLIDLINNKAVIAPILAWGLAQIIKLVIDLAKNRRLDFGQLVSSGGMPSAHSATVSALATSLAMLYGLGSPVFAISLIVASVVLYDSAGVRQSVGQQAAVLNRIVRELRERRPMDELESDLRELIGHTPFEVGAGVIIGIGFAVFWVLVIP